MAFVGRLISLTFTLSPGVQNANPTFAGTNSNTLTVSGLRVAANLKAAATPSQGTAEVQVYGMTLSHMNQLSTLGLARKLIANNTIKIMAGNDDGTPLKQVFYGVILQAWSDFQGAPNVPLHLMCQTLAFNSVIPTKPLSYNGSTDAASVMQTIAGKMGCTFENNGVNVKLSSPYLYGSLKDQADDIARSAQCNWTVDQTNTLAIWPQGGSRNGSPTQVSPPPNGEMIGYPTFANYMMFIKHVFNSNFKLGSTLQVQSSLPATKGIWSIMSLDHILESQVFHGKWESLIGIYNPTFVAPVPQPPS